MSFANEPSSIGRRQGDVTNGQIREGSEMRQTMVSYTTKSERAAENEELIKQVYQELKSTTPNGVHYATFAMEDGVSFVHLARLDDGAEDGLMQVSAFRTFLAEIDQRTDAELKRMPLREVGSYQFWGE